MGFGDAIKSVFGQYAGFSGRARRSEYWFFVLFYFIVTVVVTIIDAVIGSPILGYVLVLALIVPTLAVAARRLHDTGRSGWWQLIALVPVIGSIVLIVFYVQDSHSDNQHGPSPKGLTGGYAPSVGY